MEVFINSTKKWAPCELIKENHHTCVVGVDFGLGLFSHFIFPDKDTKQAQYRGEGYHIIKKNKKYIRNTQ